MKLGIALSGGGVRSASQLGIMQYLYEQGIKPTIFAGTSGGAIVCSLLALGYSPKEAIELFRKIGNIKDIAYWHIISRTFTSKPIQGLLKGQKLEKFLADALDNRWISGLSMNTFFDSKKLKLAIITTDITTGTQVIFANDSYNEIDISKINDDDVIVINNLGYKLSSVITASCSLPALFLPREIKDMLLIDGGITNNLPSDVAFALGADKVVSIDLGFSGKTERVMDIPNILVQSMNILMERETDNNSKEFGLYLNPKVYDVHVLETDRVDECFTRGYQYAKDNYEIIKNYLEG